ncbi:hypothetical protein [Mycobacterium sp. DL592]|uniref:hypothetical protein n=1 Tax=Mycobacterium sp. DL592 TaxID=2675524 RepID=UPI0014229525|nr:hypothetical protein [Mycobacterium sp. DL592]
MSEIADFARLSRNWTYWSELAQLSELSVSTTCDDCAILFSSNDYSVHLRHDGDWWSVDTVNDRRQRTNDSARFSSYALAEKYLVWIWGSAARSSMRAPVLGPKLYELGFNPDVEVLPLSEGVYELRSAEGRAVLSEPYATIVSRLIGKPLDDIETMLRAS